MHNTRSRRSSSYPVVWLFLANCFLLLWPVLRPSAAASHAVTTASDVPTTSNSAISTACQRAINNDVWIGQFTTSYSVSDSDDFYEGKHDDSADVVVTFRHRQQFDDRVIWQVYDVADATGSGSLYDQEKAYQPDGNISITTTGTGAPAYVLGEVTLDLNDCTYDVSLQVSIQAITTYSDGTPSSIDLADVLAFQLHNRPVDAPLIARVSATSVTPTLSGSTAAPVYVDDSYGEDRDEFYPGGAGAGRVGLIRRDRGDQTAGSAAVSWSLAPNSARPHIVEIIFKQQSVPSKQWIVVGQNGAVDGNMVMITARIENPIDSGFSLPVRYLDAESGELLPNCGFAVPLAPKSVSEVHCLWDTEGWAWDSLPGAAPEAHPNRRIRIELGSDQNLYDQQERPIVIRPKPILMVHGLNSSDGAWTAYPGFLQQINSYWMGYAVPNLRTGNDIAWQEKSDTLHVNAFRMHNYIQSVRELENAWHVDIVAHSMGGLISRRYIHSFMPNDAPDGRPVAKHLVMLGTPNLGSDCATLSLLINLRYKIPNLIAPLELTPAAVARFNAETTNRKGTQFSVLAGNNNRYICNPLESTSSDQVVLVPSAHYIYQDIGLTTSAHTAMTASQADFTSWVLPHLAIGRQSAQIHSAEAPRTSAVVAAPSAAPALQITQIFSETVAASAREEIALDLPQADTASVVVVAATGVTATLRNPTGNVVQTSAAYSEEARQWFRTFVVEKPAVGRWTLLLESQEKQATPATAAVVVVGNPLVADLSVGTPDQERRVPLTLRLTRNGGAVVGATMRATLVGTDSTYAELNLHDDGRHDDGAAGDGVYGALTDPLSGASYATSVIAEIGGETRMTIRVFGTDEPLSQIYLPLVLR